MTSKVLRGDCGFKDPCPEIRAEGDRVAITGYRRGAEWRPENEATIEVPATLVPGVMSLDIPDFPTYREKVRKTPGDQLRVQTLRQYTVDSDEDFYLRYRNGGPAPTEEELREWGDYLDAEHAAGRAYRNLHVVDGPIGEYLCYQFEWAYQYNVTHHMDVRILDVADTPAAGALPHVGDFWVLEHRHVVLARYDEQGRPLGTVGVDASGKHGYLAAADMAWRLATPFSEWWAAHPDYHHAARGVA